MKHGLNTDKTSASGTYKCVVRIEKKVFLPSLLFFGLVLCVGLYCSAAWYWLVIVCLPFAVASVAVLWWPVIEPANGVFRERALLFGKKRLSERVVPLNEFAEIFYELDYSGQRDTSDYRLGLRHKAGRKIWVEGCWNTRRSVEETAWEISCKTGIKLTEWPA